MNAGRNPLFYNQTHEERVELRRSVRKEGGSGCVYLGVRLGGNFVGERDDGWLIGKTLWPRDGLRRNSVDSPEDPSSEIGRTWLLGETLG